MPPFDPSFYEHLFEGITPGAKILIFLLITLGTGVGKVLATINANIKANRAVLDHTCEQAALAAERSIPTSDGFAEATNKKLDILMDGLNRIAERQERMEKRTERMEARQQDMEQRFKPPGHSG